MNKEIEQAIEDLHEALKKNCGKTVVSFNVFFNNMESVSSYTTRTPESLKADCVSMQNMASEFIN